MDKHWLKSYPDGVAHEIDPEQFGSLNQLLEDSFKKNAAKPFSVCMNRWMSCARLDKLSLALGAWLQNRGLEPGARVAIMRPNVPQFAVTMAAVLRAGYTCVNVNPLYTARELEHQLKDSGATAIVILENFAITLAEVIERTPVKHVVMTSSPWASCSAFGTATVSLSPCGIWSNWFRQGQNAYCKQYLTGYKRPNILNSVMIYQKTMSEKFSGVHCVRLLERFLVAAH